MYGKQGYKTEDLRVQGTASSEPSADWGSSQGGDSLLLTDGEVEIRVLEAFSGSTLDKRPEFRPMKLWVPSSFPPMVVSDTRCGLGESLSESPGAHVKNTWW